MKKTVPGWILLFLGGFLLVLAILLAFVAPGMTQKTPLNVDSNTYLSGQAQKLNPSTGKVEDVPVAVLNKTRVDPKKSDDDVIVFVSYSCVNIARDNPPPCLMDNDSRLITNSVDTFATDRTTALAVNNAKYETPKSVPHQGLVNKFPFDTQKKTYPYWDSLLMKAVPAKFAGEMKLQGLTVYKFDVNVPKTTAKIAGDVEGTYQSDKSIWVEPTTGAIVDQEQHEVRLLPDGSTVLDISLSFTSKTVSDGVKDAKDNLSTLRLTTVIVPIVAGILGLLALVGGVLLLRSGREDRQRV